jgi:hypothetical protein
VQVAGNGAERGRLRQPCERILLRHFRQGHCAFDQLTNSLGREVGGRRRSRARAPKDAQAQAAGAGLLQGFHLAHADVDAEFVALADHRFGVGGAGLHGQRNHVSGEGFQVEVGLIGLSYSVGHCSTVTKWLVVRQLPIATGQESRVEGTAVYCRRLDAGNGGFFDTQRDEQRNVCAFNGAVAHFRIDRLGTAIASWTFSVRGVQEVG